MSYKKKLNEPVILRVYLELEQVNFLKKKSKELDSDLSKLCRKIISLWIKENSDV
jgi:hypothetical protein